MLEETKTEISWTAPEFIHQPKGSLWFILVGVADLVLIIYFLFQRDYLTALLFLLLGLVTFYFARLPAKNLHIQIGPKGLKLNQIQIPYQKLKKFWIVYEPPIIKTLNFETTAYFNRFLTLQLEDKNPLPIRELLLKYIPEDLERGEQIDDKIARTLKF